MRDAAIELERLREENAQLKQRLETVLKALGELLGLLRA